jgi:hypothetical protein
VKTKPIGKAECKDCLKYRDGTDQKFVYMDYYKDGPSTHVMRLPDEAEAEKRKEEGRVENPTHDWIPTYGPAYGPANFGFGSSPKPEFFLPVVDWDKLEGDLRVKFTAHDYGGADMPMTANNFYTNIQKGFSDGTSMLKNAGYPSELYSEIPSSDFEGVWEVVDPVSQNFVEMTLDKLEGGKPAQGNSSPSGGKGKASIGGTERGTWKHMGTKDKWAVITWTDTKKIEKTKIEKKDDQYKKSDYAIGQKLEDPRIAVPVQKVRCLDAVPEPACR